MSVCVILLTRGHLEGTDCGPARDSAAVGAPKGCRRERNRERRTEKGEEDSGRGRKGALLKETLRRRSLNKEDRNCQH